MDINKVLYKLGIEELNLMQQETSDAILHSSNDVLVLSPTGSGKTLAYLLPLAERIDASVDEVQAVVIVPGKYGQRTPLFGSLWRSPDDG